MEHENDTLNQPTKSANEKQALTVLGTLMIIYMIYSLPFSIWVSYSEKDSLGGIGILGIFLEGIFIVVPATVMILPMFLNKNRNISRPISRLYLFFWSILLFPTSIMLSCFLALVLISKF